MNTIEELLEKAGAMLAARENDKAIDVLRSQGPPNDHRQCALLARAYFQRGDARGDMYASHYFSQRALELGNKEALTWAIKAMSSYKKELYREAISAFAEFITAASKPNSQYLYSLALMQDGRLEEAAEWIDSALAQDPQNQTFQIARQHIQTLQTSPPVETYPRICPTGNIYASVIEQARDLPAAEVAAPYDFNALSKLRGRGRHPKDFYWLEKNIPCQKACPAGTNIPEYLNAIYRHDYDRAYRINLWDNVFPAVLGRVCSRPCESECRHGWDGLGESVAICFSKRSAADFKSEDVVILSKLYPASGKKVAIIGAGVAGLAAARNLALLGHQVTVYEMHSRPGGMMNQGIPEFRLPRHFIDREIAQITQLGVILVCNTKIGRDLPLNKLLAEFDAVVMAAGTLRPNVLDLPGSELQGIRHGLEFLLQVNDTDKALVGRNVIVIGGGFTAMDCARTALRIGAQFVRLEDPLSCENEIESIRVAYRRSAKEMLITPGELEELNFEGIPMDFMVSPLSYIGNGDQNVHKMRLIHTKLGEPDASGRRRPIEVAGSEFEVQAQTVLLATGQFPDTSWIDQDLRSSLVDVDQWLRSGKATKTAIPKLFVAGDFATGARTLIDAIAHAKQCARHVDEFLVGESRLIDVATIQDADGPGRIREMDYVPLQKMPMIPQAERSLKAEVEQGYTQTLADDETQRCYLCHYKYEIDPDKCIYCDWCIKAKPRPDCIVKVSSLQTDDQGRITGFNRAKGSEDTFLIYINQEDCIRCNACVEACPVDCITVQKVSLQTITNDGQACGYEL